MVKRNVCIICMQETKWKGSKARKIGDGCKKMSTMAKMGGEMEY